MEERVRQILLLESERQAGGPWSPNKSFYNRGYFIRKQGPFRQNKLSAGRLQFSKELGVVSNSVCLQSAALSPRFYNYNETAIGGRKVVPLARKQQVVNIKYFSSNNNHRRSLNLGADQEQPLNYLLRSKRIRLSK